MQQPPTEAQTELFEAVEPLLFALRAVVDAQAARHPDALAPAGTLDEARAILAAARQLFSRDLVLPGLLVLRGEASWAALASRLALVAVAFLGFRTRYHRYEPRVGEVIWFTREFVEVLRAAPRPLSPPDPGNPPKTYPPGSGPG